MGKIFDLREKFVEKNGKYIRVRPTPVIPDQKAVYNQKGVCRGCQY